MDAISCPGKPAADPQRMASGASVVLDPAAPEAGVEAESRKLPSSRYKGVVSQPNGRWGAQIYERHQRVWLGTFADEADAALAYDVAVQRFRGRDAVTNFRPLAPSDHGEAAELAFLAAHSKAEIVDMLRKHTYGEELEQSKQTCGGGRQATRGGQWMNPSFSRSARKMLFDKVVTPSDVGKLNRLVVPKQHAEKHFPLMSISGVDMVCKGVLLNFEDGGGRAWRFRYSYWNSSRSYVLTKGWSRFVKEKKIKAGDVVSFWRSNTAHKQQLYIDWKSASAVDFCSVRLFGVDISDAPSGGGTDSKRSPSEMELFTRSNPSKPRSNDC